MDTLEARAERLDQEMLRLVQEQVEDTLWLYNRQLPWRLREMKPCSVGEAREIAGEFGELAEQAADEFGWSTHPFPRGMLWRNHSWKHIHENDLKRIADQIQEGQYPFNNPRLDLLRSADEASQCFRSAAKGALEAVARLNYLFPSRLELQDVAEYYLCGAERPEEIRRIVSSIPSVEELAAEDAHIAVRFPDSEEAEQARRKLRTLVSKSSAKGSGKKPGRSRIGFGDETVVLVYRMSYALFGQVKEVGRFFDGLNSGLRRDQRERNQLLRDIYPWLASLKNDVLRHEHGSQSNTEGAYTIAGRVLGVSRSKVAKIVHSS